MNLALGLVAILVLVVGNGLFVAIEFALMASDRSKLQARAREGSRSARLSLDALSRMSFYLSGAQLGITVTSVVLGFLTEPVVGRLIDPLIVGLGGAEKSTISLLIALALATVFQMVIGELIPKNIAISRPEPVAQALTPFFRVLFAVTSPIVLLFNGAANWAVRRFGIEPQEELTSIRSIDEIEYLIRSSAETGTLGPDEMSLLSRTLRFGEKTAAEALTPRVHVEAATVTDTVGDLYDQTETSGHSHYPIFGDDLDDIRGVVSITALFDLPTNERRSTVVTDIMVEAQFVPETRDLVDLLDDFRELEAELLIVLDEHGGTAGIITLEDVLEEITGDIDDEYDTEDSLTVMRPGVSVVAGTMHADEVSEISGFVMPEGDYETIAGFVMDQLGHVPEEAEQISFDGWLLEVVEMDNRRVASVQLVAPDVSILASDPS